MDDKSKNQPAYFQEPSAETLQRRLSREKDPHVLDQQRAINIDKFQNFQAALVRNEEELTRYRAAFKAASEAYRSQTNKSSKVAKASWVEMKKAIGAIKALSLAHKKLNAATSAAEKAQVAIAKRRAVLEERQVKSRELKRYGKDTFLTKKGMAATAGLGKVGGVMGEMLSMAATRAMLKFGATKAVGGLYAGVSLLAEIFSRGTRSTKDFVNAFGAAGGMFTRANFDFQKSVAFSGNAFVKNADAVKFAGTVLSSGAFGLYTAGKLGGASAATMADILGKLTPQMILAGHAMGLNADKSAELFVSLHNTMGAFGAINKASKELYERRLDHIFRSLSLSQQYTGATMQQLTKTMGDFSSTMLPLGHSFDSTIAAVTGTVNALNHLVSASDDAAKTYFNNAETMMQFSTSLFNIGKGIRPGTALGYSMVTGQGGTGNIFKDFMTMVSASPLQRLGLQIQAFQKTLGGDSNKVGVALSQAGYADTVLGPLMRLAAGSPKTFNELVSTMAADKFGNLSPEALAKATGLSEMVAIGKGLKLGEDPLDRIVTLLENLLTLASSTATALVGSMKGGSPSTLLNTYAAIRQIRGSASVSSNLNVLKAGN